jgi:hypothetical protein
LVKPSPATSTEDRTVPGSPSSSFFEPPPRIREDSPPKFVFFFAAAVSAEDEEDEEIDAATTTAASGAALTVRKNTLFRSPFCGGQRERERDPPHRLLSPPFLAP